MSLSLLAGVQEGGTTYEGIGTGRNAYAITTESVVTSDLTYSRCIVGQQFSAGNGTGYSLSDETKVSCSGGGGTFFVHDYTTLLQLGGGGGRGGGRGGGEAYGADASTDRKSAYWNSSFGRS